MITETDLKTKIELLDKRAHYMLLWSIISSMMSCSVFMLIMVRIYQSGQGRHIGWLILCQAITIVSLGFLKFVTWKGINYKRTYYNAGPGASVAYNIVKLTGQRKLIGYYLLEITLLTGLALIFFSGNDAPGFYLLLRFTLPVTIATYISGVYFLLNFTRQISQLAELKTKADRVYLDRISRN